MCSVQCKLHSVQCSTLRVCKPNGSRDLLDWKQRIIFGALGLLIKMEGNRAYKIRQMVVKSIIFFNCIYIYYIHLLFKLNTGENSNLTLYLMIKYNLDMIVPLRFVRKSPSEEKNTALKSCDSKTLIFGMSKK